VYIAPAQFGAGYSIPLLYIRPMIDDEHDELTERVAKAMFEAAGGSHVPWEEWDPLMAKDWWRNISRAAIATVKGRETVFEIPVFPDKP
jgi:hypothetical protein